MQINGVSVEINGDEALLERKEIEAYVERGLSKYGHNLKNILLKPDGDFIDITYNTTKEPFQRIRRITGYLVGTLDRFNDSKRAEEHDRVKHSIA